MNKLKIKTALSIATIIILGASIGLFALAKSNSATFTSERAAYVDNKVCLQCHIQEGKQWLESHHAAAMAMATPETVKGDFNNATFKHNNLVTRFYQHDNKYFVHTDGPDGKYADFEIKYTFGTYPLQQYLIALPGGRLQGFTIAWDDIHKHWFHLYPKEKTPAGDVLHWTGRYQNANTMCIACHTTNMIKNYDTTTDTFNTKWSEINVSCQSCHGPGEQHVKWAQSHQAFIKNKGLNIDYKIDHAKKVLETCAICHARRNELTDNAKAGDAFMDNYQPALLTEGLYYPDGQQQGEVYIYGSFLQSKMHQKGVTCTDCHNPHTGKLKSQGNAVCTQCHNPSGSSRFPTAAKLYDDFSHHHHKMGTAGAQCVNCHMPSTNYMMINARPDHSFRIPRPDLSNKLGTPNACNNCHTDKTAQWAADAIKSWNKSSKQSSAHYGEIFAAARDGKSDAEEKLISLANDATTPNIVRATALDALRHYNNVSAHVKLLRHDDPLIRRTAVAGLERLLPSDCISFVTPLLDDPIRAVRIEAARVLSSIDKNLLNEAQQKRFNIVLTELISSLTLSLDTPASNLNLAAIYENSGQINLAEKYYLNALKLDADFTPARLNLAQLYNSQQRNNDAEKILRDGITRLPQQGELHYSLGLLLGETNATQALNELAQAANYLPKRARIRYNYGLALQQAGQRKEAETALVTAHNLDPLDSSIVYAITVFYAQDQQWETAKKWGEKLLALNPHDEQVKAFVDKLNQ